MGRSCPGSAPAVRARLPTRPIAATRLFADGHQIGTGTQRLRQEVSRLACPENSPFPATACTPCLNDTQRVPPHRLRIMLDAVRVKIDRHRQHPGWHEAHDPELPADLDCNANFSCFRPARTGGPPSSTRETPPSRPRARSREHRACRWNRSEPVVFTAAPLLDIPANRHTARRARSSSTSRSSADIDGDGVIEETVGYDIAHVTPSSSRAGSRRRICRPPRPPPPRRPRARRRRHQHHD